MVRFISLSAALLLFSSLLFSQSELKPAYVSWNADGKDVSVEDGYNQGISKPEELGITVYFEKELLDKYEKKDFTLEFRWFYYYTTQREFMNKQTINYDPRLSEKREDLFSVSSMRQNISPGWWEVHIIAKYDNKRIVSKDIKRFQVYIK